MKYFLLDGLAFLPTENLQEGIQYLRQVIVPLDPLAVPLLNYAEPLLNYFDKNYVSGVVDNETGRRTPPLFPHEMWNVHHTTLNDDPRTNNVSEGGNNRFRELVGHYHPGVYKCIVNLQLEEQHAVTTVAQYEAGSQGKKRVRREVQNHQFRLQNLLRQFLRREKTVAQLLQSIGHCIRLKDF